MQYPDLSKFEGTALLTGSNGFIGLNLIKYLKACKFPMGQLRTIYNMSLVQDQLENYVCHCNLTDRNDVDVLFAKVKPTHIIHLAANAAVKSDKIDSFYDLNVKATHYLLEHCPQEIDFIFASSILVYGNSANGGCCEDDRMRPDSVYGITKVAAETLVDLYYKKGKIRPRVLRLCGNVGPGMTHGKIVQALRKDEMKLFGHSPGSYLPLCHVEDTCEAITKALLSNRNEVVANICPDDYLSLEEMVMAANPNLKIEWVDDGSKIDLIQCYNERANYLLDWTPRYSSKEALDKFVKENVK